MNIIPAATDSLWQDKEAIGQIVKSFFEVFTNVGDKQPDWEILSTICIPEVLIIKKSSSEETVYDLQSFIEPRRRLLADGTLTEFEERELEEATRITGNMAQRTSRYQKCGYLNGQYFKEYGTKCFQLIRHNEDWKICSVLWEDDTV